MRHWFRHNELLKIGSLNSGGVLIKMATGVIVNKLLAVFLAPQGLALIGNFRDFMQAIQGMSTFSIQKGVTKYATDFKEDKQRLHDFVSSLFFSITILAIAVGLVVIAGAKYFSVLLFDVEAYAQLFRFFGIAVPVMALQSFLVALVNGLGRYKTVVWIGMGCNVAYAILMLLALQRFHLEGALYTLALVPILYFLITLLLVKKDWSVLRAVSAKRIKKIHLNGLLIYAGMILFSSIAFPLLYLFIRNYITDTLSAADAGYWEAMHRLSRQYMMFVLSLMTLYLLPKYAAEQSKNGFLSWAASFYKIIIPFFTIGLLAIYILKTPLVKLLFTKDFIPMIPLFKWQLLGDLFKALAMVLVLQFHAKRMVWPYIITDMMLVGTLSLSTMFYVKRFGVEGSAIAHAVTYSAYFFVILGVFRKPIYQYFSKQ